MTITHLAVRCSERHSVADSGSQKMLPPRVRQIVEAVALRRGLTPAAIQAKGQTYVISHARQEVYYELRQLLPQPTLPMIARWFEADHTTVLWGVKAHTKRLEQA